MRTQRFKYIRNFLPDRPHLQPNAYKDHKSILIALRAARQDGRLNDTQLQLFATPRPAEELYDLKNDPFEIKNLAGDTAFAEPLSKLRRQLDAWIKETGDHGSRPESAGMYDSDMQLYLDNLRKRDDPGRLQILESNIKLMKQWAAAGK